MSSFVKEIIVDKKINQYKLCWYCSNKCTEFVAICENCKYDKLIKPKLKKPTNLKILVYQS